MPLRGGLEEARALGSQLLLLHVGWVLRLRPAVLAGTWCHLEMGSVPQPESCPQSGNQGSCPTPTRSEVSVRRPLRVRLCVGAGDPAMNGQTQAPALQGDRRGWVTGRESDKQ